ncbi:hypothetical protein O6H91_09G032000 [Diphasiastrum complanatum]|uniref:Uncharacterized protein n=4 Tax=Diphasiastrum complanatum TaxID=34168 RepID=A0ACC2CMQ9_DIPCM|nr:hypothetical protein O6H91_09G032000 [Diphasiastrum complanatum]KAJ7543291.1 hypothetical protein O6H91_09G032000 [Diphasiastrum complanatum]KAJ7543292.1 hypothetical protein O6H91_09G032000 [Diphasiastrum complanatum]KAJ7543293.1 hypothetical protein O6H91_09G032000 [Diphasiastrum complanatum]
MEKTVGSDERDMHWVVGGGATTTLLVRHLPEALSPDTLQRLFSHYGAIAFRPCVAGRLKNCAFVDFKDESLAVRAQSHLHRLRFMGKILTVEKAKPFIGKEQVTEQCQKSTQENDSELPPLPPYPPPTEAAPPPSSNMPSVEQHSLLVPKAEPIAPGLGIDYPFPPQLEYAYPPPDGNILTNIVNALIAVPRFYTQVLHLMNKMNLPAPFRPALPTPPLPPPPIQAPPKRHAGDLSSDESELESLEEVYDETNEREEDIEGPEKDNDHKSRKRAKKEAILGPAADRAASHELAGLKSIVTSTKSISAIKKKPPVLQIKIAPKVMTEGVSQNLKMVTENQAEMSQDEIKEQRPKATREELLGGKISPTEILSRATFKNYTPGNPSQVIYVKNLAKGVTTEDLLYIFGAFFPSAEEMDSQLKVKLMQEGRMRGQAFVTFPSLELAEDALATTHGFILKGKPMIVHFGKNPLADRV